MKFTVRVAFWFLILARGAFVHAADVRPSILLAMADDWAWPHAGAYGDPVARTPTFDRVAREGMLFSYTFSAAPSCTASRAGLLTGQAIHRLKEGPDLRGILRKEFVSYPDLLEAAGYAVGYSGKGWGPGGLEGSGRTRNPAGPQFKDFESFLKTVPADKPFCFWYGSRDPHRPYEVGTGVRSGFALDKLRVPPYLPDTPGVRGDIADYYFAVERYDREVGHLLALLERSGKLANTIIIMTGDNGWPFPRGKANLYDAGTRQPLVVRWPARVTPGQKSNAFIAFADFAPTLLEAAGLQAPSAMTGRSFLDVLTTGKTTHKRDVVYLERERHANVRAGDQGYPSRAIRTREYLYIRNFYPERWPAGDPSKWRDVGPYGDIDNGPAKEVVLRGATDPHLRRFYDLACGKRPAEELYELASDPFEMTNLALDVRIENTKKALRADLDNWMQTSGDPRATPGDVIWDRPH
jgi:arylsulfatase A-like enzyme